MRGVRTEGGNENESQIIGGVRRVILCTLLMCLFSATALAATTVTTFNALKNALSNSAVTDIVIEKDITITETLFVNGTKTLSAKTGASVTLTRGFYPTYQTVNAGTPTSMLVVNQGASLTVKNGITIDGDGNNTKNTVWTKSVSKTEKADEKQATGIDVYGSLILNGAKIINHKASNDASSAIIVHDGAEMTMIDGEIANNGGVAGFYELNGGGAIFVSAHARFTMNYAEIHDNKAQYGGGIQLGSMYEDNDEENGQFKIVARKIYNNTATYGDGGGIYVAPRCISLTMNNLYVGENAAKQGGGLYNCPTGRSHMYLTRGSAFVDNTASAAGDFLFSEDRKSGLEFVSKVYIEETILGGGVQEIYSDSSPRYQAGDTPMNESEYQHVINELLLHNEVSSTDKTLAKAAAQILVENNTAGRYGGGIANNGVLTMGVEGQEKTVSVIKKWEGTNELPSFIKVSLIRVDEENQRVTLRTVELNAENNWSYTFADLPGEYNYEVSEVTVEGFTTSVEKKQTDDRTMEYIITNTIIPTPTPVATPTSTPTATPTPTPTATPTATPMATAEPMQTPAQDEVDEDILNSLPKTGDDSRLGMWLGLLLGCAVLLGSGALSRRNEN